MRYELTDYEWAAIKPLTPQQCGGRFPIATDPQNSLKIPSLRCMQHGRMVSPVRRRGARDRNETFHGHIY
jgi:transposase